MSDLKLLVSEIRYYRAGFLLSTLAVVAATALVVAGPTLVGGYSRETRDRIALAEQQTAAELEKLREHTDAELSRLQAETDAELARMEDETRRLMITMGFNLLIVHKDTNMSDFWAADFAAADMPQHYVERLASAEQLSLVTHLVATLQQKIDWQNRKVLLVGYLPETPQAHMKAKQPMGYQVEPGTVLLGYELGADRQEGDMVEVLGRPFQVARILPEQGSKEDITIAMNLADAQAVLDRPGRINQILALGCQCAGERLPKIRAQLGEVLPDTKITEFRSIAVARAEQRDLVAALRQQQLEATRAHRQKVLDNEAARRAEILATLAQRRSETQAMLNGLAATVVPLVVAACAVWIGLLALANVRQRRAEIGLLRALGKSGPRIAGLLLGKAALFGLLGGAVGLLLGLVGAGQLGRWTGLEVNVGYLTPEPHWMLAALVGGPVLAALATWLPVLLAVREDPAVVLREG